MNRNAAQPNKTKTAILRTSPCMGRGGSSRGWMDGHGMVCAGLVVLHCIGRKAKTQQLQTSSGKQYFLLEYVFADNFNLPRCVQM